MGWLSRSIFTPLQRLPLPILLAVPFILQTTLAVGVALYLYQSQQKSTHEVAVQLQQEVGLRVEQNLRYFLDVPFRINQVNATAIREGELDFDNLDRMGRHFWQQLQIYDNITAIGFANTRKDQLITSREADGQLRILLSTPENNHTLQTFSTNDQGDRLNIIPTNKQSVDPHTRAWYKSPVQTQQPTWIQLPRQIASETLSLRAGHPIYGSVGELRGVLLSSVNLTQIGTFLRGLKVGKTGQCFILNRAGEMVATSTKERPFLLKSSPTAAAQKEVVLLKPSQSQEKTTQAAGQFLGTKLGNLKTIQQAKSLQFSKNGQKYFLQILPFQDQRGINWLIVVVVPESDFIANIPFNTVTTILLCLAMLVLATALGYLITRWFARPILQLAAASEAIASGNLNQSVSVRSIREINLLARSFNQMAQQIRESFSRLANTNEELEERVEERTTELSERNQQLQQEIQERQRAETALRSSESELRLMFTAMIDTVVVFDRDGRYLKYIQRPFLTYKPHIDRAGKTIYDILPEETAHLFYESIQRALYLREQSSTLLSCLDDAPLTQHSISVEYSLPIRGKKVWFLAYVSPLSEDTVLWVARDISERKETEEAIVQAKQEAENANRVKSQFLARMSHELRTPLNIILGFTQLMKQNPALDNQQQDYLETIYRSGAHLLHLINDVLDISKIEEGKLTLTIVPVDLHSFLSWLQQMFRVKTSGKGLQLIFEIDPDLPHYIQSDESKLRQILMNLLGNAIKFTEQGTVKLRVNALPNESKENSDPQQNNGHSSNETSVKNTNPNPDSQNLQCIRFEVSDSGAGILPSELNQIFEPFVQSESGLNQPQGTGLGLAICQDLARLLESEITVESSAEGSTFSFQIFIQEITVEEFQSYSTTRQLSSSPEELAVLFAATNTSGLQQSSDTLSAEALKVVLAEMPIDWINQLQQAALRVNAQQIQTLIDPIKTQYPSLAQTLENLIENYCFEELITLTQPEK
jgi:signal transduction histidine kinase